MPDEIRRKWQALPARWRRVILLAGGATAASLLLFLPDVWITWRTAGRVDGPGGPVAAAPVALVLGTGKFLDGRPNLFYEYRLDAAADLYRRGVVRGLLVSGDNGRAGYNEPQMMHDDLVARGVPAEYITMDFAGFRTLDSVVRARRVFGLKEVLIVSQRFHCERAIYLADAAGLRAAGYAAGDVVGAGGLRVRLREVLARARAFLDCHVLGTGPRFLGPEEPVNLRPAKTGVATEGQAG